MARSSKWTHDFACTPDQLLEVLVDPGFQIARSDALENPAARVKEISRTDDRLVFEVHTTEYAKGVTGIDRSKTEQTVTTYEWNLKARTCDWRYEGSMGKRVRVWGDIAIEAAGSGARITQHFNVEIKIPLVGGKIEGMVIKESEKFWPRYEGLIDDFLARR